MSHKNKMSMVNYAGSSGSYDLSPLFRAGLRGYARSRQNASVQKMLPVGANDITSMRVANLQRQVARISPNIENFNLAPPAISCAASSTTQFDYSVTGSVVTSAEFGSKYLGDKYRNISLLMRANASESLNAIRCLVYIPRVAGDGMVSLDFQGIPDETRYTIVLDKIFFPAHSNQSNRNFLIRRINLKGRLTTVDRTTATSGTIRSTDIRVCFLAQNTTTTARDIVVWYQLKFQNK